MNKEEEDSLVELVECALRGKKREFKVGDRVRTRRRVPRYGRITKLMAHLGVLVVWDDAPNGKELVRYQYLLHA